MSKISLIIVDKEENYLNAITNYILSNQSKRFKVSSFSELSYFNEFLDRTNEAVDLLLIDESMYSENISSSRLGSILLLCNGIGSKRDDSLYKLYKYQPGNEIIKFIIKILSQDEYKDVYIRPYSRKTKIVAAYSPSGGVGKTSVALVSSVLCANMGDEVLYFNLEPFQSTPLFFDCNEEENFSEIFYHIKNKSRNLLLRIEGAISVDSQSKVNYLSPPESVIDINECTKEELGIFIDEIRLLNKYDYVFIDMDSNLDEKNISRLLGCDQIILVISSDSFSILKAELFLKDLKILSQRLGVSLLDRVSIIINKFNPEVPMDSDELSLYTNKIHLRIPKVARIFHFQENLFRVDMDSEFTSSLREYLNHYVRS